MSYRLEGFEGWALGWLDGCDGLEVGCDDGWVGVVDGWRVGCLEGWREGCLLGCIVGGDEGWRLGWVVGILKGCVEGCDEGCVDGCLDGCDDGWLEGLCDGCIVGCVDGSLDGCVVGFIVGCLTIETQRKNKIRLTKTNYLGEIKMRASFNSYHQKRKTKPRRLHRWLTWRVFCWSKGRIVLWFYWIHRKYYEQKKSEWIYKETKRIWRFHPQFILMTVLHFIKYCMRLFVVYNKLDTSIILFSYCPLWLILLDNYVIAYIFYPNRLLLILCYYADCWLLI